ncbi:hypothetical protein DDD64_03820 [Actinotignum sanguinis]|nr:hypothetical protein DDD64_03820 [Actinotignum sanguinis]
MNEIRANKSGTAGNQDTHIIPFVGQFVANSTRNYGVKSEHTLLNWSTSEAISTIVPPVGFRLELSSTHRGLGPSTMPGREQPEEVLLERYSHARNRTAGLLLGIIAVLALIVSSLGLMPAAQGAPALDEGAGNYYFFKNSLTSGKADVEMSYGRHTDVVFSGDWNGDGRDTLGVNRGSDFYMKNNFLSGDADIHFKFGLPTDQFLIGNWDAVVGDTVLIRRGNTYFVRNELTTGGGEHTFTFGEPDDEVIAGDWNGDGTDTLAIRRGNMFYVSNVLDDDENFTVFSFGRHGDTVLVGDWDGDGIDSFAVRRGNMYYVNNSTVSGGDASTEFSYGRHGDNVLVGDWDRDGVDTLAVRRDYVPPAPNSQRPPNLGPNSGGYPILVYGTLRQGEEAAYVVNNYSGIKESSVPDYELWITGPRWNPWPWALPGPHGLRGDLLTYGPWNYDAKMAQMDDWEGYVPGGNPNHMNYTRDLVHRPRFRFPVMGWGFVLRLFSRVLFSPGGYPRQLPT